MKVITFTNAKGGVGKTTCSGLTALYINKVRNTPVVLIDLDAQCGSSVLFLSGKDHDISIMAALDAALEGEDPTEIMMSPYPVPGRENMFVMPSNSKLNNSANQYPVGLLRAVLDASEYGDDVTIIIDTGTNESLVSMGLAAADMVVIPMTLSKQTARPTTKTLNWMAAHKKPLLGILPVASANSKWEDAIVDKLNEMIATHPAYKTVGGGGVLPRLPYSKAVVRGDWVTGAFPEKFIPVFDAIYEKIFGESAIPPVVEAEMLVEENING